MTDDEGYCRAGGRKLFDVICPLNSKTIITCNHNLCAGPTLEPSTALSWTYVSSENHRNIHTASEHLMFRHAAGRCIGTEGDPEAPSHQQGGFCTHYPRSGARCG